MTLREYYLRLEAYQLRKVDEQESLAMQAWFNQTVQATTKGKHPKPKFKKFTQFFNRKEAESRIKHNFGDNYVAISERDKKLSDAQLFEKRVKEFKALKAKGQIDMNAWKRERNKEMKYHG